MKVSTMTWKPMKRDTYTLRVDYFIDGITGNIEESGFKTLKLADERADFIKKGFENEKINRNCFVTGLTAFQSGVAAS